MRLAICFLLVCVITGCDQVKELTAPKPEAEVDAFLSAVKVNDLPAAHALLAKQDRNYITAEELTRDYGKGIIGRSIMSKTSWEIGAVNASDSTASVEVKLTIPDVEVFFGLLIGSMFKNIGDLDEAKMESRLAEKLSGSDIPMTVINESFNLVKEGDQWRILKDYKIVDEAIATEKARVDEEQANEKARAAEEQAKRKKIRELLESARSLSREKNYIQAVEAYSAVLDEDSDNSSAKEALTEIESEIEEEKIKAAYIPKIKIIEFQATKIDTYSGKGVPAVRFGLKNDGDRTLTTVRVVVYFKDASGTVIHESSYSPVYVGGYNTDTNSPLKPNYIKRQKEGRYYLVEELGPEWKTGAAEAVITEIEFAKE